MWTMLVGIVSFLADVIQVILGVIALWIAWTQREKISNAFSILLNYSLRISLADLHHWLQELHDNDVNGNDASKKVRIALAHIYGKIKGNPDLAKHIEDKLIKRVKIMMEDLDGGRTVSETSRISICSEIQARLASLEIENHTLTVSRKI